MGQYWVYIMANKGHPVLYIGMSNDPHRRVFEHRTGKHPNSFAWRYQCWKVVLFEEFNLVDAAIAREKQLKNWKRAWKNELIASSNEIWSDLSHDWDYSDWYDPLDPPKGYYQQHLRESWGGPLRDSGSRPE